MVKRELFPTYFPHICISSLFISIYLFCCFDSLIPQPLPFPSSFLSIRWHFDTFPPSCHNQRENCCCLEERECAKSREGRESEWWESVRNRESGRERERGNNQNMIKQMLLCSSAWCYTAGEEEGRHLFFFSFRFISFIPLIYSTKSPPNGEEPIGSPGPLSPKMGGKISRSGQWLFSYFCLVSYLFSYFSQSRLIPFSIIQENGAHEKAEHQWVTSCVMIFERSKMNLV